MNVRERTCGAGHTLGHRRANTRRVLSTARESNPALLLGRQGPQPLGQRYESRIEMERAPGVEPGPSDWQSGMQPQTPCARGGQGRNRTDSYRGCNPAPSHLATWPCRGDGANRTRATVVGLGLANRPVTAPARLRQNSRARGRIRTSKACVRSAGRIQLPWAWRPPIDQGSVRDCRAGRSAAAP